MAVITPTLTVLESQGRCHLVVWGPFASGDTFTPYENPGEADRSVHCYGGAWGSATVTIKGSNEAGTSPASMLGLHDPQGNAISATADAIVGVAEVTRWIAPAISGAGASGLRVAMVVRR